MSRHLYPTPPHISRWRESLLRFLFPRRSDSWLSWLRVGLGLALACYCWSLRLDWPELFGEVASGKLSERILSLETPFAPRLGWFFALAAKMGLADDIALTASWLALLCATGALLLGVLPRVFAGVAWFIHLSATNSAQFVSYGLDNFMTIGLFYLMLSPLPDRFCLTAWWRARSQDRQPPQRNFLTRGTARSLGFWRRVLQMHVSLIYFFSGVTKCLGNGWWDGSSLWRSVIRPPFNVVPPEVLVHWKSLFPVTGALIALLETSYPVFIWSRRTRPIWLVSICCMHVGVALLMGMYLFGFVMIVLNLAAFGPEISLPISRRPLSQRRVG